MRIHQKTLFAFIFLIFATNLNAQSSIASWDYQGGGLGAGPQPAGLDTATVPTAQNRLFSPAPGDLDGDGDMDFIAGANEGAVYYFENIGTPTAPEWVRTSHPNLDTLVIQPSGTINETRPQLEDVDNDGDLDLFIGIRRMWNAGQWGITGSSNMHDIIYLENVGSPTNPVFQLSDLPGVYLQDGSLQVNTSEFTNLGFVDIDDDGDRDFFTIGSDSISYFENIGSSTVPSFQHYFRNDPLNPLGALSTPTYTSMLISNPEFEDFDNDGDFDLYFVNEAGFIVSVENVGTASAPDFSPYTPTVAGVDYTSGGAVSAGLEGDLGSFGFLSFEDLDNDNVKDAIYGNFNPGYFAWWKGVPNCTNDAASINETACGSYTVPSGDETYTSSGTYMDTIPTVLGCDSVLTINLTISPNGTSTDVQTACDSYTWMDGNTYTASNNTATFVINGGAANGCDSIITLDLTINNSTTGTDVQTACDNYTWIDGNTYTASNSTATHVLTNAVGCDSTVTLDLTINNSNTGTDTQVACDSYTWIDGNTYTVSNNTATHVLTNAVGCDSTVTLDLTINYSSTGTDVQVACDSYTWIDGNTYTASNNTATHVLTNAVGCDSTVTLDLTINNSNTGTDVQVACDSYTWIDGNTYTASNSTATHVLTNAVGCDSTVTLDLTINNSNSGTDTQVACDTYTWIDGNTYTVSNNTATHVLTNAVGCDSTVTLDLTINYSSTGTDVQVACDSYTWIDGNTYTVSNNTATHVLTNAVGCDSTVTLDLTINYSSTGTDVQAACDSYTWIDGNTYTASNNTATHVLTNAVGCDSTVTLDLTINNSNTGTDVQVACDSYTWIDGNTYTASNNTATFVLTNAAGCDSTVTLDLTINNSNTGTDTQVACDTYTWIDGNTYTASNNTATHVLTNAVGCDSTVTLDLTINYSSTGTDVQVACDSYTWIDGNTYTVSNNTATHVLTNAVGCDSTVTLDLTINNSNTGTDTQVACDTYTWIDGNTYTASNNTATHVLTNAVGCDSTVTLDLTINNSNSGTDTQVACDTYTWIDGNTYTASNNTATFVLTNAAGCDSTVTLDLTINNSNSGTDTQVACDTYTWIDGNTYTASNNTATHVLTNAVGCDSTVTLDLTINYSSTGTDVQVACDSYTWIDGNTYTVSNNTATHVLTNAVGCDSTVTLDLTINASYNVTDTQIHCDSFTWIDGITYTTDNNSAMVNLTTVEGCDSIVTLDLTINTTNVGTSQSADGVTLTADATGASYQWIDCDNNNAILPGETNQSFTATANGNYAVVVTENGCVDTSSCINVSTVGLDDLTSDFEVKVYPNPTKGDVTIDFEKVFEQINIRVLNVSGKVVSQETFKGADLILLDIEGDCGVYLIEVSVDGNTKIMHRIVKQ